MTLHHTDSGVLLERDGQLIALPDDWDTLINRPDLVAYLRGVNRDIASRVVPASGTAADPMRRNSEGTDAESRAPGPEPRLLAPVASQEIWAAGVTYLRSRTARMEESEAAGGGSFYDKVYEAVRPELFFKASPWRVRGHGETVRIRRDARWSVPEPELALVVNSRGVIVGYTIGNDMSSRDIEGENPLYLPQAKMYDGSCALGPVMLVKEDGFAEQAEGTGLAEQARQSIGSDTRIDIVISRGGACVFEGSTTLAQMRRRPEELVEFLYRETSFPNGCVLLTGTGIIPPDDFTLQSRDEIAITIAPIGILRNRVE
jgi:2-dehydro-3-deoxy-D-arabinonate dehydratase